MAHHIGKNVLENDAPVRRADRNGSLDIFYPRQRQSFPRTSRDICAQPSTDMTRMTKARKTFVGAVTGMSDVSAR